MASAPPEVSVVVPTYLGAARLPRLLAALSGQPGDHWEALIVIDGSVDDSARIVARHADRRIVAVPLDHNQGRVTALNTGFHRARGRVLIRCDDDLEPGAGWLAGHLRAHDGSGHPVGVIGLCPNAPVDTPYGRIYAAAADRSFAANAAALDPILAWRYWGGNVSVTRSTWERVGDYDPGYRTYGWEDADWGYRLDRIGVPIRIHPNLAATHHGAPASVAARAGRAYLSGAARARFERAHGLGVTPGVEPPRGPWGLLVRAVARAADQDRVARAATGLDAALGPLERLPSGVGRRLVGLLVESAALAGHDRPPSDPAPL